jgi:enoyl-CoA hydratase
MSTLVSYERQDAIATITMDDGRKNVLSLDMFAAIAGALDRAEAERAAVLLTGREGVFSAGFDLRVLMSGGEGAYRMVRTGFELAERVLAFPTPVVVACTGHAIAMGAFLLLAGDYRLGVPGPYKIGATEVALGITMPHFGVEICRQRLTPAHFHRAVINAEVFDPEDAAVAGFLDRVVPADALQVTATEVAAGLAKLDAGVHAATKLRARSQALQAVRAAIAADAAAFEAMWSRASA